MGAHARVSLFASRRILLGTIEAGKLADLIVVSRKTSGARGRSSGRLVESRTVSPAEIQVTLDEGAMRPVGQLDLVVRNPDPIDPFFLRGCGGPARPTRRTFSSITVTERGEASC